MGLHELAAGCVTDGCALVEVTRQFRCTRNGEGTGCSGIQWRVQFLKINRKIASVKMEVVKVMY